MNSSLKNSVALAADSIISTAVSVTTASGSPNAGRFTVAVAKPETGAANVMTPGLFDDHTAVTSFIKLTGTWNVAVMFVGSPMTPFKLSFAS